MGKTQVVNPQSFSEKERISPFKKTRPAQIWGEARKNSTGFFLPKGPWFHQFINHTSIGQKWPQKNIMGQQKSTFFAKSNVYVYGQPGEGKVVVGHSTDGADHGCGQETHPGSDPPSRNKTWLGVGFNYIYFFYLHPQFGEDFDILTNIFQMEWNHQPDFIGWEIHARRLT